MSKPHGLSHTGALFPTEFRCVVTIKHINLKTLGFLSRFVFVTAYKVGCPNSFTKAW